MSRVVYLQDIPGQAFSDTIRTYRLLDEKNGCVAGCSAGVTVFTSEQYNNPGIHADQEGYFVLEGAGWARIGAKEFNIEPGAAFLVPAGTAHSFRKEASSAFLKLFWFHAAI